jgi:protein-S-isoprenylcysteine O-methyltransferase Ste14
VPRAFGPRLSEAVKTDAFLIVAVNLGTIGALPRIFFRRDGRLNLRWWMTAAPFFACGLLQVAHLLQWIDPIDLGATAAWLRAIGVVMSACSIGLIWYTVGTHRIPLALWHQHDDEPVELVTWGSYRWVRHPFYSAFLLALIAGALITPHVLTLATTAYGAGALNLTARREERRLQADELGDQYRTYMCGVGRFVPRIGRGCA